MATPYSNEDVLKLIRGLGPVSREELQSLPNEDVGGFGVSESDNAPPELIIPQGASTEDLANFYRAASEKRQTAPQPVPPPPPIQPEQPSNLLSLVRGQAARIPQTLPPEAPPIPQPEEPKAVAEPAPPPPVPSAPPPEEALEFPGSTLGTVEGLKEAQSKKNQISLMALLGSGAADISGAISGVKPEKGVYEQIAKRGDQLVEDYKDQIKQEKLDPNSPISKGFKSYLKKFGVTLKGAVSADAAEKIFPYAYKQYAADLKAKEAEALLKEKQKAVSEEKKKDRELKQQQMDAKAAEDAAKKEAKEQATNTKRFDDLNKKITGEIASSRSAFGKAANNYRTAEAIEALVGNRNPDSLDIREVQELARSLDALLSQGQATISGAKELVPKSAIGNLAKLEEFLLNKRKGAELGSFVKQISSTVAREKELAHEQLSRTQKKILASFMDLADKDPEKWTQILEAQGLPQDIMTKPLEEFKVKPERKTSSIPGETAKDPKIQEWADQHQLDYNQAEAIINARRSKSNAE